MTTLSRITALWPQTPTTGPSPREVPNVDRGDLAELFGKLGFKRGVEVGTEYGEYAETLLRANPELKLWCVDPYKAYKDYRDHKSQLKLDEIYRQAQVRFLPFYGRQWSVRWSSVEAAANLNLFPDDSLDFVYIDGNHTLLHVIQDLVTWVPKVRKGGVISGHDFIRRNNRLRYQCHVVEAVYAYTQCYLIDPWYVVGSKGVVAGEKRDSIRSFFWVKE